jgi:hypothetical protein
MAKARWSVPLTVLTKSGDKIRLHATGTTKKKAVANGRRMVKRHMKNIEQGFYAGGIFHPIRGSSDYDSSRAGEGKSGRAAKSRAKRATRKAGRPR